MNNANKIKIVAHRGGANGKPGNTIAAFARAVANGADAIECDIALTHDNEPVVFHISPFSDKIKNSNIKIWLSRTNWRDLKNCRVENEPIPHLNDLFDFLTQNKIECFIEPKVNSTSLVEKLVRGLTEADLIERAHLLTFFWRRDLLTFAKEINPAMKTSLIFLMPFGQWWRIGDETAINIIVPGWKSFNHLRVLNVFFRTLKRKMRQLQDKGVLVYAGIANDAMNIRWLAELGVDGISTDDVPLARQTLSENF